MPTKRFIQIGPVEETYAHALLMLAEESGQLVAIAAELAEVAALAAADADLARLLTSRALSATQRAQTLERLFKGRVSDLLYRFLMVGNRKGRLDLLAGVARAFALAVEKKQGVVEVEAFVAAEMGAPEAQRITAGLEKALSRRVVLHQRVDPALIGGLKIRVGDQVIDGTIAAQLRMIRAKLVEAGRERARSGQVA